ncbi:hypothetical protein [Anoxybacteroides tepidamans]|uniref:hypothetical protein n=1 Tax=Anoxybacteroides tepidamans TaxID=265948 RepID=UPI0004837E25|nr:hypothetical protein [Anoxybacillus tepidamans]
MSENKKPRVIHVDKLIIHADDVVIVPRRRIHDPWFSPRNVDVEGIEEIQEENQLEENEEQGENEGNEGNEGRRPFSWI